MTERVYLDSNVFIYPVIYEGLPKSEGARAVLEAVERGELRAYTSTLTWDEVVWVVRRLLSEKDSVAVGRKLLGFPNLKFVAVSEEVVARAQRLVEKYGLKPRDSIHCASSILVGARTVVSDDEDLDVVKELSRVAVEDLARRLRGGPPSARRSLQ